ncbi:MAG: aminotransferase DegT [Chloroflexi bacterium RBG_16_50_9]|nr:MAG: aminotransferase DegT [Chloroflexi bacterium RBG_16_50_9]
MKIPLFKIFFDEDDIKEVTSVIEKGMHWAAGPDIRIFEVMISQYVGAKYCLIYNSGTSALHAILLAYGIGPGDEVIVPSFTFIATANAPLFVGARPVFADIEEQFYGLDPEDVKSKITPRTKAIIPVHYGGSPCLIRELRDIAAAHNLLLIEDAAEAFGAAIGEKKTGTFGDAAMFSFCQNKIITTGEGGAVVTDSEEIYQKLKMVRSHGRLDHTDYFTSTEYLDYVALGYNFRPSDISAALGIAQLKKVDKIIEMRQRNANYMTQKLIDISEIIVPETPGDYFHVHQMYTVRTKGDKQLRDRLMAYLVSKGIMTKVHFYPVHLSSFYRERFGHSPGELPTTERVSDQILTIPMYPTLSQREIDYIGEQFKNFFSKSDSK